MAAIGKQLKQSVKVFQSLILYRLLPIGMKVIRIFLHWVIWSKAWGASLLTFVIKSIDTVDASALVVAS
jgi:hypothetical protein